MPAVTPLHVSQLLLGQGQLLERFGIWGWLQWREMTLVSPCPYSIPGAEPSPEQLNWASCVRMTSIQHDLSYHGGMRAPKGDSGEWMVPGTSTSFWTLAAPGDSATCSALWWLYHRDMGGGFWSGAGSCFARRTLGWWAVSCLTQSSWGQEAPSEDKAVRGAATRPWGWLRGGWCGTMRT